MLLNIFLTIYVKLLGLKPVLYAVSFVFYRYSVEKIPLYDSAEDEPSSKVPRVMDYSRPGFISHGKVEYNTADASVEYDTSLQYNHQLESTELVVEAVNSVPMELVINEMKTEISEEAKLFTNDTQPTFPQKNALIAGVQSNSMNQNNHIMPGHMAKKRSKQYPNGRSKPVAQKQVDAKFVAQFLGSEEARKEVFKYEVWFACFCNFNGECKVRCHFLGVYWHDLLAVFF